MGNQQLLLVILVTIIIAMATIIAINLFGDNAKISNRSAVKQDLFAGTNIAQALYQKHELLGGAGRDFTRIEESILVSLMIPGKMNGGSQWENENAVYVVEDVEAHSMAIRGKPTTGKPHIIAFVSFDTQDNFWMVSVADAYDE